MKTKFLWLIILILRATYEGDKYRNIFQKLEFMAPEIAIISMSLCPEFLD